MTTTPQQGHVVGAFILVTSVLTFRWVTGPVGPGTSSVRVRRRPGTVSAHRDHGGGVVSRHSVRRTLRRMPRQAPSTSRARHASRSALGDAGRPERRAGVVVELVQHGLEVRGVDADALRVGARCGRALEDQAVAQGDPVVVGGGEVRGHDVARDAGGAQQQRHRDAGAVLARRAVHEQRTRPVRGHADQRGQPRLADAQQEHVQLVETPALAGLRRRVTHEHLGGEGLDQRQRRQLAAEGHQRVRPPVELLGVAQVDHAAGRPGEPAGAVRRGVVGERGVGAPQHPGPRAQAVDGRHPADVAEVGEVADVREVSGVGDGQVRARRGHRCSPSSGPPWSRARPP